MPLLPPPLPCVRANACTRRGAQAIEAAATADANTAVAFASGPAYVDSVLSLMEVGDDGSGDFHVRYAAVRALCALLRGACSATQAALLASANGVARLMDMLLEGEALRNEALLALALACRGDEQIGKMAVFEGAFDRAFNVVREEGGADGGVVVQDALELLASLLRGSPSNQTFFREATPHMATLPSLLRLQAGGAHAGGGEQPSEQADGAAGAAAAAMAQPDLDLPRQQAINLMMAVETVSVLLSGGTTPGAGASAAASASSNRSANATALAAAGVLDSLLGLACGPAGAARPAVRIAALQAAAQLVAAAGGEGQERLGSSFVQMGSVAAPALNAALNLALYAGPAGERAAAAALIRAYCVGNADGQLMLASTIMPMDAAAVSGSSGPHMAEELAQVTFGSMLVRALSVVVGLGGDMAAAMAVAARAAGVLASLLEDNHDCQCRVLSVSLDANVSASAAGETLMGRALRLLGSASVDAEWLRVTLLRMLVAWTHACPKAVRALLQPPATTPMLLELCASGSPHVSGMGCAVLACCLLHCSPADEALIAKPLLDAITARVGLAPFSEALDALRRSPQFAAAAAPARLLPPLTRDTAEAAIATGADAEGDADTLAHVYDAALVGQIASLADTLGPRVVVLYSAGAGRGGSSGAGDGTKSAVASVQSAAAGGGDALRQVAEDQACELDRLRQQNAQLADQLLGGGNATSAESGMTLAAEMDGLREALRVAEAAAAEARNEATGMKCELEEARDAASKALADLESLSSAYNTLEAANETALRQHDAKVADMQARLDAAGGGEGARAAAPISAAVATGASAADLQRAREEGAAEARAEAEAAAAEAEGEMNDLLACLGIEEEKCEVLSARLTVLGEDVGELLEGIGEDDDGEAEGEGGESLL